MVMVGWGESPPLDDVQLNRVRVFHVNIRNTKVFPRQGCWATSLKIKCARNFFIFYQVHSDDDVVILALISSGVNVVGHDFI